MSEIGVHIGAAARSVRAKRDTERTALRFATVDAASAGAALPEWPSLPGIAAGDNAFFSAEFALPAMLHLGASVSVAAVTHPGGALAAVAPFTRHRLGRIAPAARVWAHDYAPLGQPLVEGEGLDAAVARLIEGLAPTDRGQSLILPDMPLDGLVALAVKDAARRAGRPIALLDQHLRACLDREGPGGPDPRSALASGKRKELGRQMRRLADVGSVEIVSAVTPAEIESRFEMFLALEAAGWKGKAGSALGSSPKTAAFARAAVRNCASEASARIDSIDVDGKPIAMLVSFISGATAYTWKIAYDEMHARFSPGAQVMLEAASRLFADIRVQRIDSCAAANHPLVDHLWRGRLAIGTMVVGPAGGGVMYSAGLAAARAELAARAAVRRLRS
jgi:CelD/BcsL family acetyltransferase involved in cellulose biosynthesis